MNSQDYSSGTDLKQKKTYVEKGKRHKNPIGRHESSSMLKAIWWRGIGTPCIACNKIMLESYMLRSRCFAGGMHNKQWFVFGRLESLLIRKVLVLAV